MRVTVRENLPTEHRERIEREERDLLARLYDGAAPGPVQMRLAQLRYQYPTMSELLARQ